MAEQVYRARNPKASPLWQCLDAHFDTFLEIYPEVYEREYGFLRPIIPDVVEKFMGCGDFAKGFARVRCDHCAHEYLLAFSCKGRWFCPSCHQKKVQLFGALLAETILAPVPHRHLTFTIPKMLRPYFRFHRGLIKELCRIAHACLAEFQRTTLGLPDGITGVVMAIHTFGEYLDFHPHLHALVADGLFVDSGLFYVMPEASLAPMEELFRARVITFLVNEGFLPPERANMLRSWKHSGFNIHRSQRVPPGHREDMERLAQYIIRNPFSLEKMRPNSSGDSIIYRSGMNPKIGRNFEVFSPCDFIARTTQHIPDKSFQLVRYYGWYSNKMRGQRFKRAEPEAGLADAGGEVIEVSEPKPRRIPSKKWRELIKKVWEADPLLCPHCQNEMRIVALIDQANVIERILRHLGLWEAGVRVESARDPPAPDEPIIEPWLDDPFPDYDHEPVFAQN
ncbi:MAG: transposase [Chthoniobacterales bacterium]|jgi:Zn finger protein HypA/HybF involved in hydrogenase expression|nr:transposase [Chthoniobacterales bacterium]